MSRRRSTGDLVPRDITEILAREARAQRGQKKPGSSLGQALNWLRGSRRKKSIGNGLNRTLSGVTDAKLGLQNHDTAKAGPKGNEDQKRLAVHYTASRHHQENVFIEGSRPQYLEDLHTEAQEGLKIQQQEEHGNEVNFAENESIASTDTLHPEQEISSCKDRGSSPESSSTTGNTDTTDTQSALTRQGSTFKPLNPVKRLERNRKRSRRTTIMGIPNQVQKELALNRSSTFQPLISTQLPNPDEHGSESQSGVVIIPTVDGGTPTANKEGARVHLSELEAFRDEQLVRKHLQSVYQDEQSFNHQGSHLCPATTLRPKSVAVPGMTTSFSVSPSMFNFLLEPQGPVMSISPQATYLSTIIPNAVLPASVEVIEIDRSTSRTHGGNVNHGSSVRTVSKSSLTSGDSSVSPLLSRRSDGDGSQANNSRNDSTPMPTSASGSNWSESQSSKTIISNSSPASSKKVGLNVQESQAEQLGEDQELASTHSSVSGINSPSSKGENATGPGSEGDARGSTAAGEQANNKRNSTRLSVMKTKQPPAPPRRTNSLHSNRIRSDCRVVVDIKDLSDSASDEVKTSTEKSVAEAGTKVVTTNTSMILTPVSNSADTSSSPVSPSQAPESQAGGAAEPPQESSTSSPLKTPPEGGKFERTMSPSSGYSSQSGTPTLSPKDISPTSPNKPKKPVKPERSVSRASSSAASPSSSLTSLSSGTSELANPEAFKCSPTLSPQGSSATDAAQGLSNNPSAFRVEVRELLNIPPPPKVKAPCPPPPETWAHNRLTVDLLCGPCPNVIQVAQKPANIQDITDKQAETQTETRKEEQVVAKNQTTTDRSVSETSENKAKLEALSAMSPQGGDMEQEVRECLAAERVQDKEKANEEAQREEQSSGSVKAQESPEVTPKKDPPPVMKKPTTVLHRGQTEPPLETQQREMSSKAPTKVHLPAENNTSTQNALTVTADKNEMDRGEIPHTRTPSIEAPKMNKISPPPTPPPAYHPTPPLSRKTPPPSVLIPPNELQRVQEESQVVESCWPPPPPPLEGESVFDGGDEEDFPPPPPPLITDSVMDEMNSCATEMDLPEGQTAGNQDLIAAVSQPAVADNRPMVDVSDSKADAPEEVSCQPAPNVSSVTGRVSPQPVKPPPAPPLPQSESPVKGSSLQTEAQSPSAIPACARPPSPPSVPAAPPPPTENLTHGVHFKRQPSGAYRDARSKELLSRHKSTPIPKEDANIPLVTPSLLQMVRLRSVSMTEDQVKAPSEDKSKNEESPVHENYPLSIQGPPSTPQKPIRKSLSLKSLPQTVKTPSVAMSSPSMRLQEAIRMKTAAMSRDNLPSRVGVRSPASSCVSEPGAQSLKPHDGCEMHKSPASTASFIFSRSTKKVVIETAAAPSPEAQASLKQSLAAELMQVSDKSKAAAFSNGGVKCDKVPPPVAKKPALGSLSAAQNSHSCPAKMELSTKGNGAAGGVQHSSGAALPETTTRVTADTIETLF
ncbi:NHS-like protein 3 isoform X2 [Leuresthes tenuis]|uniref:NHS-like protein 3 isoform X2 n=1 Tax=Leuresthes tenuis TaxID=355514 RepID=UPI003B50D681